MDSRGNRILFSHKSYLKLAQVNPRERVTLLQVFVADKTELSPEFIDYDTRYDGGRYPLTAKRYLVLLFLSEGGVLFTTLRRHTPRKEEYYRQNVAKKFRLTFTDQHTK